MDGVINVRVNGYSMVKDHNCAGAQFEGNSMKLKITFGEDWDDYAKTVTFWDALGQNPTKVILGNGNKVSARTYYIGIPEEVLSEAGMITFTVNGYLDGVKKRTVADSLKVLPSRKADDAEEPTELTPTPHEQLQLEIANTEEKLKGFYKGGETNEIKTSVSYVTFGKIEAKAGEKIRVYVDEDEESHNLRFLNSFYGDFDFFDENNNLISSRGPIEGYSVYLGFYIDGKRVAYYEFQSTTLSVDGVVGIENTIFLEKASIKKTISANIKDKAVKMVHLSDEVADKIDSQKQETDPTVPMWAKQPNKPTYTADEVGALPKDTPIPTKISELENDKGYLTKHQDISGKADKDDTYTKEEIDNMNFVDQYHLDQVENRVIDMEMDMKNMYTKSEVDASIDHAIGVVLGGES